MGTRREVRLDGWDLLLFVACMPLTLLTFFVVPLEVRVWPGMKTLFFVSPVAGIMVRRWFFPPPDRAPPPAVGSVRRLLGLAVMSVGGFVMIAGGIALWFAIDEGG